MKNLFIFLDYDGTLTPIVAKPHQAKLPRSKKSFLNKLSKLPHITITVISGRMLSDIKKRVGLPGIYYAGNHGLEISGPKTKLLHPKARAAKPLLQKIKKELAVKIKGIKGALIEDKILTLSLHYRLVRAADQDKVSRIFDDIVKPYLKTKKIRVTRGKKVLEIRPNVDWDKGKAVLWFLDKKAKKKKRVFPIYIGDDVTDEDAFKVLKHRGLTFRVGLPTETQANHIVETVEQVYELLQILALEI